MLNDHPCCRIPALALDAPVVLTSAGGLRPERAVLYNRPFLLLHHFAACQSEQSLPLSEATMAGLGKTATRLWALLTRLEATEEFIPLYWQEPEGIGFVLRHTPAQAAADRVARHLIQAEAFEARTLLGEQILEYWRC